MVRYIRTVCTMYAGEPTPWPNARTRAVGIGIHLAAAPELVVEAVGRYVDVKARQQL